MFVLKLSGRQKNNADSRPCFTFTDYYNILNNRKDLIRINLFIFLIQNIYHL